MKIAYFDCIAGASGDMILGALLDAGLPQETLLARLSALQLDDFELRVRRVSKNGFAALKVDVQVADESPERHLSDIAAIIQQSDLPPAIQQQAMAIFTRLCQVEAGIHGNTPDRVHLHELGGVDTIVDVVGALLGLETLEIERVYASPLPLGRGFIHGAHGQIPLPAPATVALLSARGAPVVGSELAMELVTPTGAALLTALAHDFGPIPPMTLTAQGYGAGGRDLPIPNVLRLLLGESAAPNDGRCESLIVLETNIDDLNPEIYEYVMARLFAAGALDVFWSPIHMKKNRPGILLHVLCRPDDAPALQTLVFAETSTLGVRQHTVLRQALPRSTRTVQTPLGAVRVKRAEWSQGVKFAPEYEDCRRLAEEHGVPLHQVYQAAAQAAAQDAQGRELQKHT